MTELAVAEAAQDFWNREAKAHQKVHGRPSILEGLQVLNVRLDKRRQKTARWIVLFSSRVPDGGVVDSPPAVIVDDDTAEARFGDY